jgi:hypothetical protein
LSCASYGTEWEKRANTGDLSDSEAVFDRVSDAVTILVLRSDSFGTEKRFSKRLFIGGDGKSWTANVTA